MADGENKILAGVLSEMIWPGRVDDFGEGRIAAQGALVFKEVLLSLTSLLVVSVLKFVAFGLDLG